MPAPVLIIAAGGAGLLLAKALSDSGNAELYPLHVASDPARSEQKGSPSGAPSPLDPRAALPLLKRAKDGLTAGGAATTAATVAAGVVGLELQGAALEALGRNDASGDTARTFGLPATVGLLTDSGVKKAAELLGADAASPPVRHVAQTAGIGAGVVTVLGTGFLPAVVTGKLVAEGASALIGAIGGEAAEQSVRNAVSELDPTKTGSLASNVTGAVGGAISGATSFLTGGLLGGPSRDEVLRGEVESAYLQVLGRASDPGGLAHFLEKRKAGETDADVRWAMKQSAEYQALQAKLAPISAPQNPLKIWKDRGLPRPIAVPLAIWNAL